MNSRTKGRYKKLDEILGEGSYKIVTKAIDEEEGKAVAYNEVRMELFENLGNVDMLFSKEIALLKTLDHPYIIKIFDYWFTDDSFVFITELMNGGTLKDYISKFGPLNMRLIKKWGKQILEGLNYLHTQDPPIIHRDIKNENIFINSLEGDLKIGDFGIARERRYKRYTVIGTPFFMAREIFEGKGYSEKVDIYAFGMTLIEMATGNFKYSKGIENHDVYKNILRGFIPELFFEVKDNCLKSLIMSCLSPSNTRYSAKECLLHHFFLPEHNCIGDCISNEKIINFTISEDVEGMELILIRQKKFILIFQLLLMKNNKLIKFEYNCQTDTVIKVANELLVENILDDSSINSFIKLLSNGIKKANISKYLEKNDFKKNFAKNDNNVLKNIERHNILSENYDKANILANKIEIEDNNHIKIEMYNNIYKNVENNNLLSGKMNNKISKNMKTDNKILEDMETDKNISKDVEMDNKSFKESETDKKSFKKIEIDKKISKDLERKNYLYDNLSVVSFENTDLSKKKVDEHILNNYTIQNSTKRVNVTSTKFDHDFNQTLLKNIFRENVLKPNKAYNLLNFSIDKKDIIEYPATTDNKMFFTLKNKFNERFTDTNNLSLNEIYENCKIKYQTNCSIMEFAYHAALITGRSEEVADHWIKSLKTDDITTVFDFKILLYEDWERLSLTVFAARVMQNMIYGPDNMPIKESQLSVSNEIKEYKDETNIEMFINDVCELIGKKGMSSMYKSKLKSQDIRKVGELKIIHQDDWNRLGLSVYAYRILKNVIFRKGKITFIKT